MATKGRLSDLITWDYITDNQVVFSDNHTIQKTYAFIGRDSSSMTIEESTNYLLRLNNIFKRLKTGWMLWLETQNIKDNDYPANTFVDPLLREFDNFRANSLAGAKNYRQIHYLTLVYKQPSAAFRQISGLVDKENKEIAAEMKNMAKNVLDIFRPNNSIEEYEAKGRELLAVINQQETNFLETAEEIQRALSPYFPELKPLSREDTLTYLHSIISDTRHPIKADIYYDTARRLSDSTFLTGRTPKIGNKHLGVVGIKDLPNRTRDFLTPRLDSLSSEYRFSIRYMALSKEDAMKELKTLQTQHHQRAKSLFTVAMEAISNKEIDKYDEEAILDEQDATLAYEELVQDNIGFGYSTINIVLLNEDKQTLENDLTNIKTIINDEGFVAEIERDNATEAWLSSLPSCYEFNCRTYLTDSTNTSAWSPISSLWEGQKGNKHFKTLGLNSQPLMKCATPENLPFYLNLHVDDVGHTIIAGATGTGKSVLLNTIASNFKKYENAKVFIFDKSASSRIITQALAGNFYNLLVDVDSISFQPLANVDNPVERTWACDWLCDYLAGQNMTLNPGMKKLIMDALHNVANSPMEQRTITALITYLQNEELREALLPLSLEGAYGSLFDSSMDKFGQGNWQVFECEKLMENANIVAPTLDYLFHRIEGQLTGVPALIILDECWLFFNNPTFRQKIVEYLKDLRKKNCSVVLATQNLSDIDNELLPIVVENTKTKIYLANESINAQSYETYEKFGLNEKEIELVKFLIPKKQYYYKSALGNRIFDLALSPLEMAFLTATSKQDQLKAAEMKSLTSDDFVQAWRKYKL